MSTDGLFTARESAITKPAMKPAEKRQQYYETESPVDLPTIDINDAEALRRLAKAKLVAIIQNGPVTASLVPAIRELMDRVDGKPAQSVNLDATVKSITVNAHISFAEMPVMVDNVIDGAVYNQQLIDNE